MKMVPLFYLLKKHMYVQCMIYEIYLHTHTHIYIYIYIFGNQPLFLFCFLPGSCFIALFVFSRSPLQFRSRDWAVIHTCCWCWAWKHIESLIGFLTFRSGLGSEIDLLHCFHRGNDIICFCFYFWRWSYLLQMPSRCTWLITWKAAQQKRREMCWRKAPGEPRVTHTVWQTRTPASSMLSSYPVSELKTVRPTVHFTWCSLTSKSSPWKGSAGSTPILNPVSGSRSPVLKHAARGNHSGGLKNV